MTGQDLVLVLGAYTTLVLGAFGLLIKFALESRRTANETNRAVNHRGADEPTVRDLIEELHTDVRELSRDSDRRHGDNVKRFALLDRRVKSVEADLKTHMRELDEREGR